MAAAFGRGARHVRSAGLLDPEQESGRRRIFDLPGPERDGLDEPIVERAMLNAMNAMNAMASAKLSAMNRRRDTISLDRLASRRRTRTTSSAIFSSRIRHRARCGRFLSRARELSITPRIVQHSAARSAETRGGRSEVMIALDIDSDWREVDRNLRRIAARRAALDAEEARWLREAERLTIWRPLGMVSALDYMERILGYSPHAAMERLRVARSLESLPLLEAALDVGELNFSAIRELTRVATRSTEGDWRDRALGKNVRQVEQLVAGHAKGSHPDDPVDPDLRRRSIRFELSPEVFARLRQVQTALADEHGGRLDDDALVTALCDATLDRGGEPSGRAKFQVLLSVCKRCDQGWQEGGGIKVAVDAAAVERARCDAQYIGANEDAPLRAEQDIPPSVVRFVWRRDGGVCQTPGCRSARGLEIHHLIHRADGGTHDPANLRLQCSSCHMALHRGALAIADGEAHRPDAASTSHDTRGRAPSNANAASNPTGAGFGVAAARAQARDALVGLGWKPAIARGAVDAAMSHVGGEAPLEALIREALRRCPRPSA